MFYDIRKTGIFLCIIIFTITACICAKADTASDNEESLYYTANDYYNMKSGGSLHIIPHFETFQQTTEYTCGCVAAQMVLNYYGIKDYDEFEICELAGTVPMKGTSVEGLLSFLKSLDLKLDCHDDTKERFTDMTEFEKYLVKVIDAGAPVLVEWLDWDGHWQVVIGIDTCGADDPFDDVLIMADPLDITDHDQDGYYVVPLARFFYMWQEPAWVEREVPYEQPFITVYGDD